MEAIARGPVAFNTPWAPRHGVAAAAVDVTAIPSRLMGAATDHHVVALHANARLLSVACIPCPDHTLTGDAVRAAAVTAAPAWPPWIAASALGDGAWLELARRVLGDLRWSACPLKARLDVNLRLALAAHLSGVLAHAGAPPILWSDPVPRRAGRRCRHGRPSDRGAGARRMARSRRDVVAGGDVRRRADQWQPAPRLRGGRRSRRATEDAAWSPRPLYPLAAVWVTLSASGRPIESSLSPPASSSAWGGRAPRLVGCVARPVGGRAGMILSACTGNGEAPQRPDR